MWKHRITSSHNAPLGPDSPPGPSCFPKSSMRIWHWGEARCQLPLQSCSFTLHTPAQFLSFMFPSRSSETFSPPPSFHSSKWCFHDLDSAKPQDKSAGPSPHRANICGHVCGNNTLIIHLFNTLLYIFSSLKFLNCSPYISEMEVGVQRPDSLLLWSATSHLREFPSSSHIVLHPSPKCSTLGIFGGSAYSSGRVFIPSTAVLSCLTCDFVAECRLSNSGEQKFVWGCLPKETRAPWLGTVPNVFDN